MAREMDSQFLKFPSFAYVNKWYSKCSIGIKMGIISAKWKEATHQNLSSIYPKGKSFV